MISFLFPYAFSLLILPFLVRMFMPAVKGLHGDALKVPFIKDLQNIHLKAGGLWGFSADSDNKVSRPLVFLYVVFSLIVVALARPQFVGEPVRLKNYGRDILMVMDISTSMLERDFALGKHRVDRLTAVKAVASEFIKSRAEDRIGLVLFGTRAYLQSPITFDKESVKQILMDMEAGMAGNSTAIGDALGLALKSLKDSPNLDKKIIILLTDGENNDGSLSLPQAISLAKQEKVKVYTIGVGSDSSFIQSFMGFQFGGGSDLDEASLKRIADETKGTYFRAKDTNALVNIYNEINKMEPMLGEESYIRETKELYFIPLLLAFLLAGVLVFVHRRRK